MNQQALKDAFVKDHRHLTKGLSQIVEALQQDHLAEAVQAAEELDRVAGAHIAFEEEVFYPRLVHSLGQEYVDQLYHEHFIGQRALRNLLALRGNAMLPRQLRDGLISQFRIVLNHAVSCGTLIGHLSALDEEEQAEILQKLREMARAPRPWTELPARAAPEPASVG